MVDPECYRPYEESLLISRGNGDRIGIATALTHLGRVSLALGDDQQAQYYLKDGLTMALEILLLPLLIDGLISVATLLAHLGDKQQALDILTPTLHHPASEPQMRARAERLLAGLTGALPSEILAQARVTETLEAVVAGLLARHPLI